MLPTQYRLDLVSGTKGKKWRCPRVSPHDSALKTSIPIRKDPLLSIYIPILPATQTIMCDGPVGNGREWGMGCRTWGSMVSGVTKDLHDK